MASLARRIAPAAALGGLAVVIVGVADPAIANLTRGEESVGPEVVQPMAASVPQQGQSQQGQSRQGQSRQGQSRQGQSQQGQSQQGQSQQGAPADGGETSASCATSEQVAGQASMTPWGPVQVVASVDGATLCAVQAVDWPQNDRKSQMINSHAIPQLDAAYAQDSTQFHYVSGATYTSDSYAQSLQSILDGL